MYADDTQLLASYNPLEQEIAAEILQKDLQTIENWMVINKLTINSTKTQLITFGTKQQLNKVKYQISSKLRLLNETPIQLSTVRNLGIEFDANMTWSTHIDGVCSRINSRLIQIARAKPQLPKKILESVIQSLALSHIHYCTLVWSTTGKKQLAKLQRCIRFAEKISNTSFRNLTEIIQTKTLILAKKATSRKLSDYINTCQVKNMKGNVIKSKSKTNSGLNRLSSRLVMR
jgi:hypothetical protein